MTDNFFRIMMLFVVMVCELGKCVLCQTPPSSRPRECAIAQVIEQNVTDRIFSRYGNWQRPVRNVTQPININITLALSSINDVLEKYRVIRITGYLSIRWFDQLRVWNDTFPLNCVTYVVLPATEVWLPDIALMNAEGRYTLMNLDGEKVRVYSDGYTLYSPGGTFSVFCEYDLTLFPFDEQMCAIKFESWRYTHTFMTFNFLQPTVKIYQWLENEQWQLVNTSQSLFGVSYIDPENSFDRVEFYMYLKRKSRYYVLAIITPGSIISVAQFSIFALPLDEVQKVSILFTCLLAYLVFMLMIVGDVPRSSDKVPLLSIYVDASMALIAMSILGECIVFFLLRRSRTRHPDGPGFAPRWVGHVTVSMSRFLRIRPYYPFERKISSTSETSNDAPAARSDNNNSANGVITEYHQANGESANKQIGLVYNVENSKPKRKQSIGSALTNGVNQHQSDHAHRERHDREGGMLNDNNDNDHEKRHDIHIARVQWHFIADIVDRLTLYTYIIGIIFVPVAMFALIPSSKA